MISSTTTISARDMSVGDLLVCANRRHSIVELAIVLRVDYYRAKLLLLSEDDISVYDAACWYTC